MLKIIKKFGLIVLALAALSGKADAATEAFNSYTVAPMTTGDITAFYRPGCGTPPCMRNATAQALGDIGATSLALTVPLPVTSGGTGLSSQPIIYPESYGAVGDAKTLFDGAFTDANTTVGAVVGSSTTPATPTTTTVTANDFQVSVFSTTAAWSSAPSTGTTRSNLAFASGKHGMFVSDQLIASPGATSAVSGTMSGSSAWDAATIDLAPSGGSISFVAVTTYQNSASTTATLNKPTGTTTGDYLMACISYYSIGANYNVYPPTGFYLITSHTSTANQNNLACFGKVATSSEPSSYAFTTTPYSASALSGEMLTYRNTSGPDSPVTTFTSATASFPITAAGKVICIATIGGGATFGGQECGTITAYNSATSVNVSFPVYGSFSSLQFSYGTDDSAAFTSMLGSAPCSTTGCNVQLSAKHYAVTRGYTLPPNIPITINGLGPSVPNTANSLLNGNTPPNANNGTQLQAMSQYLGGPLLTIGGTLHTTSTAATDTISNLALIGGAGLGMDGGGSNGLNVTDWQGAFITNVFIFNFQGHGAYVDGLAGGTTQDYIEAIAFNGLYSSFNNGTGLQVGSSAISTNDIETVQCTNCIIEANGGPALGLRGRLEGFLFLGGTVQWNNRCSPNPEVLANGTITGGLITATYFEETPVLNSKSSAVLRPGLNTANAAGAVGLKFRDNHVIIGTYTPMVFSAAGTAVPTCATFTAPEGQSLEVSDSTECVGGTTYTSGGSTACYITCVGSTWKETGAAKFD